MTKITFPLAQVWGLMVKSSPDLPACYKNPEITLSYPLLTGRDTALDLAWFAYPLVLAAGTIHIGRPLAIIEVKWKESKLSDIKIRQNPTEFSGLTPSFPVEYKLDKLPASVSKETIYLAYTPIIDFFPSQSSGRKGKELARMLKVVIEPELMPFYLATSPLFFDWLSGNDTTFGINI